MDADEGDQDEGQHAGRRRRGGETSPSRRTFIEDGVGESGADGERGTGTDGSQGAAVSGYPHGRRQTDGPPLAVAHGRDERGVVPGMAPLRVDGDDRVPGQDRRASHEAAVEHEPAGDTDRRDLDDGAEQEDLRDEADERDDEYRLER